jgi:hypothetical protein
MAVRRNPLLTTTMKQFSVFVLILCASWGFLAHKTLQQISIYQLPDDLRETEQYYDYPQLGIEFSLNLSLLI